MSKFTHSLSLALIPSALILGLSSPTIQAQEKAVEIEERIEVMVKSGQSATSNVDINVNGAAESFEFSDLAEGESKTITTQSGKEVLLKKVNGETLIDLDGKTITIGNPASSVKSAKVMTWVSDDSVTHAKHNHMDSPMSDSIIVVGDLSKEAQKAVKDALKAQGVDKKVIFPSSEQNTSKVMFISSEASNVFTTEDGKHIEMDIELDDHMDMEQKNGDNVKKQYRIIKVNKDQ